MPVPLGELCLHIISSLLIEPRAESAVPCQTPKPEALKFGRPVIPKMTVKLTWDIVLWTGPASSKH